MTDELQAKMAEIISTNILTPIIYMIENDEVLDFICFCDRNITMEEIYEVERRIMDETGQAAEIIDIREFPEPERLEVINQATLIHSENPMLESIFERSMAEDYRAAMLERKAVIDRRRETGTVFLQ